MFWRMELFLLEEVLPNLTVCLEKFELAKLFKGLSCNLRHVMVKPNGSGSVRAQGFCLS